MNKYGYDTSGTRDCLITIKIGENTMTTQIAQFKNDEAKDVKQQSQRIDHLHENSLKLCNELYRSIQQ
jgi:hypothetical protein